MTVTMITQKNLKLISHEILLDVVTDMNVSIQRIWATIVTLACVEGVLR